MSQQALDLPRWIDVALLPLVNLALALLVCGLVVALVGLDPRQVITLLVKGAFGSRAGIGYTLYYATTFVFTGLAVAVAFHGGLFNIGGEGQALMGGLGGPNFFVEGLIAKWAYISLHLDHHRAIMGTPKTVVLALARLLQQRVAGRLKLH